MRKKRSSEVIRAGIKGLQKTLLALVFFRKEKRPKTSSSCNLKKGEGKVPDEPGLEEGERKMSEINHKRIASQMQTLVRDPNEPTM